MTTRRTAAFWVAAGGAIVTWAGLLLQLALTVGAFLDRGGSAAEGAAAYLGYFTILTNIAVALALSSAAVAPGSALGRFLARPSATTAVAAGIVLVGCGYHFLIAGAWDPQGWLFVASALLHYATPALFLVFWWLSPAGVGAPWRAVPIAALYPLAYFLYVLARGALTGFYPYEFLDVARIGFARVMANAAALAVAHLGIAAALVAVSRARRRLAR